MPCALSIGWDTWVHHQTWQCAAPCLSWALPLAPVMSISLADAFVRRLQPTLFTSFVMPAALPALTRPPVHDHAAGGGHLAAPGARSVGLLPQPPARSSRMRGSWRRRLGLAQTTPSTCCSESAGSPDLRICNVRVTCCFPYPAAAEGQTRALRARRAGLARQQW